MNRIIGYQPPYPMGGTDPEPEPQQQYDLTCLNCNWQGMVRDTGKVYVSDPQCPDEVIPELCCPICGSLDFK